MQGPDGAEGGGELASAEARLKEALDYAERFKLASELSHVLAEAVNDVGRLANHIARTFSERIGDFAGVTLVREGTDLLDLVAVAHPDPELDRDYRAVAMMTPIRIGEGVIGKVIRDDCTVVIPVVDPQEVVARAPPEYRELSRRLNVCSLVGVPMHARGRVIGGISMARSRTGVSYSESDRLYLQDLADRAALVMDNARLYANLEQRVAARTQELKTKNEELEREILERRRIEGELREANERAQAAARAKQAFLSSMSHEIRTPMNAVIGMTGLLLDASLSPEQRELAETVRRSGEHLLGVINDILDFSKIEAGKMELARAPFELRSCLEDAIELVAVQAADKGLELVIDNRVPDCWLLGDAPHLRQVVVNLLSNAVKFTAQGEVVLMFGERPSESPTASLREFEVAVRDTGIGLGREAMARLFQPFSQVDDSTTRKYGGTGLGLAISKRLVEAMGGNISVHSEVDRGSCFRFTFRAETASPPPGNFEMPDLRGTRILVVDDHEAARTSLRAVLESWGIEVFACDAPTTALERLRSSPTMTFMLIEHNPPIQDGVALAQTIRSLPGLSDIAIAIMTTGGALSDDLVASGLVQATLRKPIKQSRLHDVLISLSCRRSTPTPAPARGKLKALPPLRILVAEDNIVNQRVARLLLEKMGQKPDIVSNGLEALAALQKRQYDVVLMDCEMPEKDGVETSRELRRTPPDWGRPYIVAMTANVMEGDKERCLEAGMDDYVAKPIRAEELRAALVKAPRHASKNPSPE